MHDFDLSQFLTDVFQPQAQDRVLVLHDMPTPTVPDHPDWKDRRDMAADWEKGFAALGVASTKMASFPATGANNGDLPTDLAPLIAEATVVVAMTEFSATAPLSTYAAARAKCKETAGEESRKLRIASMPRVLRRMEKSALAADYRDVARKAHLLKNLLQDNELATIRFSTGHTVRFDLQGNTAEADDGYLGPDKEGFPLINLPSGEAFVVPNESAESRTQGQIPVSRNGETVVFEIVNNQITEVSGEESAAAEVAWFQDHFAVDAARRNVAELGLGCNERAVITGNVLEDEKAGLHWAYGRSEHLGGGVSPDAFSDPSHVIHQDIVYAKGCPIEIAEFTFENAAGERSLLIRDGKYVGL